MRQMHFYRIAGALILVLSGVGGAYMMNSAASEKLRQSEALGALLRFIRAQIECFAMPASEILARCDRGLLRECGYCKDSPPESFEALLAGLSFSDAETAEIMAAFLSGFGKSYRDEQIRECDYYIALLRERAQKLGEELPNRRKVNSALCVSSALAAVILLL